MSVIMTELTFIIDVGGLPVIINRSDYDADVHILHASQSISEVNDWIKETSPPGIGSESVLFTPELRDSSFSNDGQTYVIQTGKAVKIGAFVFFEFQLKMLSIGGLTVTNSANIIGFPFPIVGDNSTAFNGQAVGLGLPLASAVTGRFDSATQSMRVMAMLGTAGHSSMTIFQLSSDGDLKMAGSYQTNP